MIVVFMDTPVLGDPTADQGAGHMTEKEACLPSDGEHYSRCI